MEEKKEDKINGIEDRANSKGTNSLENYLQQTNAMREAIGIGLSVSVGINDMLKESVKGIAMMAQQTEALRKVTGLSAFPRITDTLAESMKALSKVTQQTNAIKELAKSVRSIDFENIQVENDGELNYLGKKLNVEKVLEDVNNHLQKEGITEEDYERLAEELVSSNPIIRIIVTLFLVISFINTYNEFHDDKLQKIGISHQIYENVNYLVEDIGQDIDEVAKFLVFIVACGNKTIAKINDFAQKSPAIFTLVFELLKYLVVRIYKFIKERKGHFDCSDDILADKKRTIKFIKSELNNLIKKEFNNEIITKVFSDNFGIINHKIVCVRTNRTIKSPIIYKLILGEVVTVVDKCRSWTKIKFEGVDNYTYMGWIFTCYITKVS